jgi:hypothetical protein
MAQAEPGPPGLVLQGDSDGCRVLCPDRGPGAGASPAAVSCLSWSRSGLFTPVLVVGWAVVAGSLAYVACARACSNA